VQYRSVFRARSSEKSSVDVVHQDMVCAAAFVGFSLLGAARPGRRGGPAKGYASSCFCPRLEPGRGRRTRSWPGASSSGRCDTVKPTRMLGGGGGRGSGVSNQDRLLATLPYLVPLLDSLTFGFYFFRRVPLAGAIILAPLYPVYQIYRGVPFLAFGVFLILYLLVVRNMNIPRFIRFNTYQALVLDIALIFPQLLSGVNLGSAIPAQVVEILSTSVFYATSLAIGYSAISNVKGELPDQIPGVSDSVRDQIGPL
jgi:hypothetical protein